MTEPLFPEPPAPKIPAPEFEHDPALLIVLAERLRPLVRAGVRPLDVAQHICDARQRWLNNVRGGVEHEHVYSITTLRCVEVEGCTAKMTPEEFKAAVAAEQRAHGGEDA
jgi:hypothetical protein